MAFILTDTNILLRSADPAHAMSQAATGMRWANGGGAEISPASSLRTWSSSALLRRARLASTASA